MYEKLHPNVNVGDIDDFSTLLNTVFHKFGIKTEKTHLLITTLIECKQNLAHRNDDIMNVYGLCTDAKSFLRAYESCCVSEAQCERLFSFLKRQSAAFMRKSLNVKTLTHLGRINVNII